MDKTMNDIFSYNLRNCLYMAGKTQVELAKSVGVSETSVSKWISGATVPRPKMIEKICVCLRCRKEDLLLDHTKSTSLAPADILADEMEKRPDLYDAFNGLLNMSGSDVRLVTELIKRLTK